MKRASIIFAALIASLIFSSCAPTHQFTNRTKTILTFGIDFREYTEKGFLFMPDNYFGEYEVLGIIKAELHPDVVYFEGKIPQIDNTRVLYFWSGDKEYTRIVKDVDVDELVKYIYDLSVEWGGDAFTNFKTESLNFLSDPDNPALSPYHTISGMVIKRK